MTRLAAGEFEQADGVGDWRVLGGGLSAWFTARSLSAGAELITRVAELTGGKWLPDVDLRASGVHVRIGASEPAGFAEDDVELARTVSAAARELGLVADPAALQILRLAIDVVDRPDVMSFWRTTFAYEPIGDNALADPLHRDPAISFHPTDQLRPLRNRIHVDVSRGAETVDEVKAALSQEPYGAYGLTLADAEGNEIDLVPGDGLPDAADWQTQFGAMTFYPTASPVQASGLAAAVARLADDADEPVLVDLRPDGVTIDGGKDQWEVDGEARPEFVELAGRIQAAAHNLGLTADPTRLRFVQLGIDAVDVPTVRAFWKTLLGYEPDPRTDLTDIYDPRRLNPVIMFQEMDASDEDRRKQRNRIHVDLDVPHDQLKARIDTALAAGGRLVTETPQQCLLTDPEGLEIRLITQDT
ncbi:VOC family protein [Kribbella sp. NPDC026596]|uniref:VOC family protein n=1 Tax=Kribbella sp. NPDC026596 TaxID=3155122 RepID=UPI00340DB902